MIATLFFWSRSLFATHYILSIGRSPGTTHDDTRSLHSSDTFRARLGHVGTQKVQLIGQFHPGDLSVPWWLDVAGQIPNPCDFRHFRARPRDRHVKISAHAAPTIAVLSSNMSIMSKKMKNQSISAMPLHFQNKTATCSGTA